MKTCTKCKLLLDDGMYYASSTAKGGLHPWCKSCVLESQRQYRLRNADKISERRKNVPKEKLREWAKADHLRHKAERNAKSRAYYEANKQKVLAYQKQYAAENADKVAEYKRKNKLSKPEAVKAEYERNKPAYFSRAAERRALKISRVPAWADVEEITEFYKVVQAFNKMYPWLTLHVDHIVPLKHERVSGLHTPANLRIVTAQENLAKSNRFWPNM